MYSLMFNMILDFIVVLIFGMLFAVPTEADTGSCRLEGIPDTTTSKQPYNLPPIPDSMDDGDYPLWEVSYVGSVVGISSSGPYQPYLTARFSVSSRTYWLSANSKTKDFVAEQKTREMVRFVRLKCHDGSSTTYYLSMTFLDIQAPGFTQDEYHFNITTQQILKGSRLSNEQVIFVSGRDNAVDLEIDPSWSRFMAMPDIIRVEAQPLWIFPNPALYHYQLDLYLKTNSNLTEGNTTIVSISAIDEFHSGAADIILHVSVN